MKNSNWFKDTNMFGFIFMILAAINMYNNSVTGVLFCIFCMVSYKLHDIYLEMKETNNIMRNDYE